ncbi:jg26836 [Pararge aegeria aegeria]|uniref:Jg26836 protein n=1 Tax=Pararge aegeria aegeria TaxID=348720 RepID=A0A8S4SAB4_9NEOP|nr:jg26836 [Pararge aegeria aegeria]
MGRIGLLDFEEFDSSYYGDHVKDPVIPIHIRFTYPTVPNFRLFFHHGDCSDIQLETAMLGVYLRDQMRGSVEEQVLLT